MTRIKRAEEFVYQAVEMGELEIDDQGQIWRLAARRYNRWTGMTKTIPCARRRAENSAGDYLQIRMMLDGKRVHAGAHRLVWRHFNGSIPEGMTINHKNGHKKQNWPGNLEPATDSEQIIHVRKMLGKAKQDHARNNNAKLTEAQVAEIRIRRARGESLLSLAAAFGVAFQTISKIARGKSWVSPG